MKTECSEIQLSFQGLGRRRVEAEFDAGLVATATGALPLREVAASTRMMERIAALLHRRYNDKTPEQMCGVYVQPCNPDWLRTVTRYVSESA